MTEKFSLYDLIGYIFPGTVIVCVLLIINKISGFYSLIDMNIDSFFYQCVLLLLSYVSGMAIHLLTDFMFRTSRNKKDNPFWRLKWITKELDRQPLFQRNKLMAYLNDRQVDYRSELFRTTVFGEMFRNVRAGKEHAIRAMQSQVTMFGNSCTAFLLATLLIWVYMWRAGFPCVDLLKYVLPPLCLAASCYLLAVVRQKTSSAPFIGILRTV
jgi:hypothetical protein